MRNRLIIAAILISFLTGSPQYVPSDSIAYTTVGRALLGDASDIVVEMTYAYVALSTGLLILDVSKSDSLFIVSNTYLDPQTGSFCKSRIFKEGNYVYLSAGGNLYILDASDPYSPAVGTSHSVGGNSCLWDVVVDSSYIYLGDRTNGTVRVLFFNGSGPPHVVSAIDVGDVRGLFLSGTYLFAAIGSGGDLFVYSLDNPESPQYLARFDSWDIGNNVFVQDDIAYFANGTRGLRIIDVKNHGNPIELGHYDPEVRIYNVVVEGGYAYTSSNGAGFRILDVSDPSQPKYLGGNFPGGEGMVVVDNMLYVAQPNTYHDSVGIQVFDVTDPHSPDRVGSVITGANYNDVKVYDNLVYVTGWDFGIQIFPDDGVYDPNDIVTVNLTHAEEMVFSGDVGFLLGFRGVRLLDWSDPFQPEILSSIDMPYEPQEAVVVDSVLYVACGVEASVWDFPGAFQIYDISDVKNPRLLSSLEYRIPFYDMDLTEEFAYLVSFHQGIRIMDITDTANPTQVNMESGLFTGIKIAGTRAYVASDDSLFIYDITAAPELELLGKCPMDVSFSRPEGILRDDYLMLSAGSEGIIIVDISAPERCKTVGQMDLPALEEAIFSKGDKLYVTTFDRGVFIVELEFGEIAVTSETSYPPESFHLYHSYPNPFNPSTIIAFAIPKSGLVTLRVYDLLGREIDTILNQRMEAGHHKVQWSASNVPSGIYLVRLRAGDFSQTRKAMVLR